VLSISGRFWSVMAMITKKDRLLLELEGRHATTGYDCEFVDPLPSEKECAICQFAARNPLQLISCGHRYCEFCWDELVKTTNRWCAVSGRVSHLDLVNIGPRFMNYYYCQSMYVPNCSVTHASLPIWAILSLIFAFSDHQELLCPQDRKPIPREGGVS